MWERTVFLVCAAGHEQAEADALALAKEKETEYLGATGEWVRRVLVELEQVTELCDQEFKPGAEVYWEFFHKVDKNRSDIVV